MDQAEGDVRVARFGNYELDLLAGELRKDGTRLRLQDQPCSILKVLLERSGEIVSREELRQRLWPAETYVDFDTGLNSAMNRLRQVLGDSADNPRFIQTVARRGYRFIAPVEFTGGPEAGLAAAPPKRAVAAPEPAKTTSGRRWKSASALLVAAAMLLLAGWTIQRRLTRFHGLSFRQVTFQRGMISSARFAGDGETFVYASRTGGREPRLQLSRPNHPEPLALDINADVVAVSSKDEMALALHRSSRYSPFTLALAPLMGGKPREIADGIRSADWSPNGDSMALVRAADGFDIVEYPSGKEIFRTTGWISDLRVSPTGERLACFEHPRRDDDAGRVMVLTGDGQPHALTGFYSSANGLAWSKDAKDIWYTAAEYGSARHVYVLPAQGGAPQLMDQVPESLSLQDVAGDGRLLVTSERLRFSTHALLGEQSEEQDLSLFDASRAQGLSDDGTLVLMDESGQAAFRTTVVYLRDLAANKTIRLAEGVAVAISQDKQMVLTKEFGSSSRMVVLPVGPGKPRQLPDHGITVYWAVWLPDGTHILYAGSAPGQPVRLYLQSIEGGNPQAITEGIKPVRGALSSDGRSIALVRQDNALISVSLPDGKQTLIGSLKYFNPIDWSMDGKTLYARTAGTLPVSIFRIDVASGQAKLWRRFTPSDPSGVLSVEPVLMSGDASIIVYTCQRYPSDLFLASYE